MGRFFNRKPEEGYQITLFGFFISNGSVSSLTITCQIVKTIQQLISPLKNDRQNYAKQRNKRQMQDSHA